VAETEALNVSPRKTLVLLVVAGVLAAFIGFVERPLREARLAIADTRVFPMLQPSSISAVEVQIPGRAVLRVERTNATWELTKPLRRPAEAFWITTLLTNLAALRWEDRLKSSEFDGLPETMREFGLSEPRATLSLHLGKGMLQLLIGTNSAAGDQVYVRQAGAGDVYLVSPDLLRFIPGDAATWRSRRLFPGNFTDVTRVQVRSATGLVELERPGTNGAWRMTSPWNARADNGRILAAIDSWRTNFIRRFAADGVTDLQPFGLQAPALEVLVGSGPRLDRGLSFGAATTNVPPLVHASQPGVDSVFLVPVDAMSAWRGLPKDFLDRRIVDAKPLDIRAVEVSGGGRPKVRVAVDATGAWTIAGSGSLKADTGLLGDAFAILTSDNTELEKAIVTDFKPYGLDQPLLEYEITVATSAGTNRIVDAQFGVGTNGVFYVHRADEDAVKIIAPADFLRLPQSAWQFKDRRLWSFKPEDVVSVTVRQKGTTRKLVRAGPGDWRVDKGAADIINPFGVEEAVTRLGNLQAEFWTQQADDRSRKDYGFDAEDYTLTIELKSGPLPPLALGGPSPYHNPYAMTVVNGVPMVFEFPLELHYNFIREFLSPFKTGTL
jgi:hypothetical protein